MSDNEFIEIPFDLVNEVPEPVSARSAERAQRAGYGTSITVPNQDIPDEFRALLYGVDSLYLTFEGTLKEGIQRDLERLKEKAKERTKKHEAQFKLGDHNFEVHSGGRNFYKYVLSDGSYEIEADGSINRPLFSIKVLSSRLHTASLHSIADELSSLLTAITATLEKPKISRADLHMDFAYLNKTISNLNKQSFVCLAKKKAEFSESDNTTGWILGAGGRTLARLYDKSGLFLSTDDGSFGFELLRELWEKADWVEGETIWRIEFQLRREPLRDFGIKYIEDLEAKQRNLWSYLTGKWLKICVYSETDSKRSRWLEHSFWTAIRHAAMDMEYAEPLKREPKHHKAPSKEHLAERLVMTVASYAAVNGGTTIADAQKYALDIIRNLDMRYGPKERRLDDVLKKTILRRNRSYNLRINNTQWRESVDLPAVPLYDEEIPF